MLTPDSITIRTARLEDAQLLSALGAEAFAQAFGKENTPEDMAAYLRGAFYPARQAEELAHPGSTFFILESAGKPAGYAHILESQPPTCITGKRPIELARFYLLQDWIGKGLAASLMQVCITEAQGRGADEIWLGVWQKNPRAIAFYKKSAFEIVGTQTFQLGSDLQHDYVMRRSLLPG